MFTVNFEEYKQDEKYFCSVAFGIDKIKEINSLGYDVVAKNINGLILDNPYIIITCKNCNEQEEYTIDDLVTEQEKPSYKGKFVICTGCNRLIALI